MSEIREALTAVGAAALVPKVISRAVLDYQRRFAPVLASIPTIKWETDIYTFATRNSRPTGGQVVDGGARPMNTSVYVQNQFPMKHTQIIGGVTGYAAAVAAGTLPDLLGKEIEGAMEGMYWDLETLTIWGSAAATFNNGAPQFDGFDNMVSQFSGSGQNCFDVNASLSLGVLDKLADQINRNTAAMPFNSSWMFVCSPTAQSRIAQLMQQYQQFVNQVEVAAGLLVPTYRNIPIVASSFLGPGSFQMAACTSATATTGGFLPASTTYRYVVTAVIGRSTETLPCGEVTQATGAGTATNTITLSFTPPGGQDGGAPILYKVYRTAAGGGTGTETLLGTVDAQVGVAADGVTPILATSIIDTGAQLVPAQGATVPQTLVGSYANGNVLKLPSSAGQEPIYLVPRNEDFLVRPYVREAQRLPVATTVLAPDVMPFAAQTDTVVALRGPKYIAAALRVNTSLAA